MSLFKLSQNEINSSPQGVGIIWQRETVAIRRIIHRPVVAEPIVCWQWFFSANQEPSHVFAVYPKPEFFMLISFLLKERFPWFAFFLFRNCFLSNEATTPADVLCCVHYLLEDTNDNWWEVSCLSKHKCFCQTIFNRTFREFFFVNNRLESSKVSLENFSRKLFHWMVVVSLKSSHFKKVAVRSFLI